MTKSLLNRFVLIGAGNVATKLAYALKNNNKQIVSVYSRNEENAKKLAEKVGAEYTNDLKNLTGEVDVYIIAITDTAIEKVAGSIKIKNGLLLHTAGSVDISILKSSARNYGVLYPLQTLSRNVSMDFYNDVPLCIEANNSDNLDKLKAFAKELSSKVQIVTSEERMVLHIAAVFVNNFTNYMYLSAGKLLQEKSLSYSLLMPIISQTVKLVKNTDILPELLTGPAVRKDMVTIEKHLELLKNFPDLKRVYEIITQEIIKN